MRTNDPPIYCILFQRGHADEYFDHTVYRSRAEAKRYATALTTPGKSAEVCERRTVYEVKP